MSVYTSYRSKRLATRNVFAHLVYRQHFKRFAGLDNRDRAIACSQIHLPVGISGRRPMPIRVRPLLLVVPLARLSVEHDQIAVLAAQDRPARRPLMARAHPECSAVGPSGSVDSSPVMSPLPVGFKPSTGPFFADGTTINPGHGDRRGHKPQCGIVSRRRSGRPLAIVRRRPSGCGQSRNRRRD